MCLAAPVHPTLFLSLSLSRSLTLSLSLSHTTLSQRCPELAELKSGSTQLKSGRCFSVQYQLVATVVEEGRGIVSVVVGCSHPVFGEADPTAAVPKTEKTAK